MNTKIIIGVLMALSLTLAASVRADALKIAPLNYDVQLEPGQKKKGFVDITNSESSKQKLEFKVQAFEQTAADGSLRFYDDEQMSLGIVLDYSEYEIEPGQTLRLAFLIDGSKLPQGDSFAAIFASNMPARQGVAGTVRVGTILTLLNGSPSGRQAEVTNLQVPFWQIGNSITGSYGIKNTSDPKKSTGFRPVVDVSLSPISYQTQNKSSLVFAGIERRNDFSVEGSRFGFYNVIVAYGGSKKNVWVFTATPLGVFTAVAAAALVIVGIPLAVGKARQLRVGRDRKFKRHTPSRH